MMPALVALLSALPGDVPVDPDGETARQWIIQELSRPAYQAAQPTWFDRVSSAFWDWLRSLDLSKAGAIQLPILLIVGVVILATVIAAFLIFGAPRRGHRSTLTGSLFGEHDDRDAETMRRSAEIAAAKGDWTTAIQEMFRSIARGLAERTVLTISPGTTARDCAVHAARSFPALGDRLAQAARDFDDVRYLGRDGTPDAYRRTAALAGDLRAARPVLEAVPLENLPTRLPG